MRKELLREITHKMLQDAGSDLCRLCADYFGIPSAEFAEAMKVSEPLKSNTSGPDTHPARNQNDEQLDTNRSQTLPLSQVYEVINRRGRHSGPRVLHAGDVSADVPRRSREFGGGWQFVMLRVVAECLGQGLRIPWSLGSQLIVDWDPGNMTNPKVVKWSGKDLYISTNRSGPNIVDICNSMCDAVGVDPDNFRVEFTFDDKH